MTKLCPLAGLMTASDDQAGLVAASDVQAGLVAASDDQAVSSDWSGGCQ